MDNFKHGLVSGVYEDKRRPIDTAASRGMVSSPESYDMTKRERDIDSRWGPTPPEMVDTVYHHPVWEGYQSYLNKRFGSLTIVGFTPEPSKYRIFVVRCDCGRYGTKRRGSFKLEDDKCSACVYAEKTPNPYRMMSNKIPYINDAKKERAGEKHSTLTILGRRHGSCVVQCECGSVFSAKRPETASCSICRDYVYLDKSQRSLFPEWWPINKEVISKLDSIRAYFHK